MTRLSIDDQVSEINEINHARLSEVLNSVVSSLPPNRVVTKVLLDGKQLSQLPGNQAENPHILVKDLEIRTVDREVWTVNGWEMALSSAERVQRSLIRAAELFRDGSKAEANRYFVHCVDGLERFYEAIVITRSVLRIDFKVMQVDGISLERLENEFSGILKSIISFQEAQDFIGLADKVEYELITNLYSWVKALKQLSLSQRSNA